MARPKKSRRICKAPDVTAYNKGKGKDIIEMSIDEYESIRLIDNMGLTQQECAKQMAVARSTITAVYENARYKLSDSLINDKQIKLVGNDFDICENSFYCCGQCGKNKCGRCKHGSCELCIGIFHEAGQECFTIHS